MRLATIGLSMKNTLANSAEQRPGQVAVDVAVASILVYVDFDAQSDNRIKIAADWARKFDASLIGVAGWLPGREIGGWFAAELEPAKERNDRILMELGKLGEHFRNLASRTVQTIEWRGSFLFRGTSFQLRHGLRTSW
jgi:hypothetical protein